MNRPLYEMRRNSGRTEGVPETAPPNGGGGGGEPQPDGNDTIIFDTRAGGANNIQTATSFAQAIAQFSEEFGGITWSTNFDGLGTRAFRHQYTAASGCSQQEQSHWIRKFLPGSTMTQGFFQFKTYFGRHANDSGTSHGSVDVFHFTNDPCNTANGTNYGMKLFLVSKQSFQARCDIIFGGPAPTDFSLRCDLCGLASHSTWDPADHNGEKLVITLFFKNATGPPGSASDGTWRAWVNDTMIIQDTSVNIGNTFWGASDAGPEYISVCNTPQTDGIIYTWDHLIWVPNPLL